MDVKENSDIENITKNSAYSTGVQMENDKTEQGELEISGSRDEIVSVAAKEAPACKSYDVFSANNNNDQTIGKANDNVKSETDNNNVEQKNNVKENVEQNDDKVMNEMADTDEMVAKKGQRDDLDNILYEFEILKKKQQILSLENELARIKMESKVANPITGGGSLEILKAFLPVFDGTGNFKIWLAQLKNVRENYEVEDKLLRLLICNRLKGKAQEWIFSNPMFMTESVDELINDMTNTFGVKESKLAMRQTLEKRIWQKKESFGNYFNAKLILSNGLNLAEDEFLEYVIEGIPDTNLRNTAKLQHFGSKTELLQAFTKVELANSIQKQADPVNAPKQDVKCYNCNSKGHMAKECRKPKREDGACFACGKQGHQAKDCSLYKRATNRQEKNEYNA
ncbi:hypothetical protein ACLKA7_001173 [Drosophila subpalustris]